MAERWELICHHTYQGIPGIVLDRSPTARSPGRAVGLANADFLRDGATPGSGAVSFYKPGARIHVPIGPDNLATWQPLGGVKVDVTFRREPHPAGSAPSTPSSMRARSSFTSGSIVLSDGSTPIPRSTPTSARRSIRSGHRATCDQRPRPPAERHGVSGFLEVVLPGLR
jgi:hypothetical protein